MAVMIFGRFGRMVQEFPPLASVGRRAAGHCETAAVSGGFFRFAKEITRVEQSEARAKPF